MPGDAEVDAFVAAVRDAGVQLIGLNFFAGDLPGRDCGVLSWPGAVREFRDNVDVAVGIGERLGLPGVQRAVRQPRRRRRRREQDELAAENLALAARAAERIGGTVLVEPVSGPKPYPLRPPPTRSPSSTGCGAERQRRLLLRPVPPGQQRRRRRRRRSTRHADRIGHVQIADSPGRGEPGTGDLDRPLTRALAAGGYSGRVALEYKPRRPERRRPSAGCPQRRAAADRTRPQ